MKQAAWILIVVVAGLLGAALFLLFTGPRMDVQPNIRAYQTRMPALPRGVIPVEPRVELPSTGETETVSNPLPFTPETLERGRVYYGYYCLFCHGVSGQGDGPVGQSYVPVPAVLTKPEIQAYKDGQLLRAMLTGTGHAPVLERVVPPEHRWPIVLYVRSLASP